MDGDHLSNFEKYCVKQIPTMDGDHLSNFANKPFSWAVRQVLGEIATIQLEQLTGTQLNFILQIGFYQLVSGTVIISRDGSFRHFGCDLSKVRWGMSVHDPFQNYFNDNPSNPSSNPSSNPAFFASDRSDSDSSRIPGFLGACAQAPFHLSWTPPPFATWATPHGWGVRRRCSRSWPALSLGSALGSGSRIPEPGFFLRRAIAW